MEIIYIQKLAKVNCLGVYSKVICHDPLSRNSDIANLLICQSAAENQILTLRTLRKQHRYECFPWIANQPVLLCIYEDKIRSSTIFGASNIYQSSKALFVTHASLMSGLILYSTCQVEYRKYLIIPTSAPQRAQQFMIPIPYLNR